MTIFSRMSGLGAAAALVLAVAAAVTTTGPASAQGVFCPTAVTAPTSIVGTVPNIKLTSGNCTNPIYAGAFSGAALASQAIGDLAGSSTIPETSVAVQAIGERREAPVAACPAGQALVDGICRAVAPAPTTPVAGVEPAPIPAIVEAPAPPPAGAAAPRPAKARAKRKAPPVVAAAPLPTHKTMEPMLVDQSFRIGAWAQGFGDYEHRTGDRNTIINCCTGTPGNTNITPLLLEATSNTTSGGFVGGIDGTKRGLWSAQDGITFGLLGGYTWTNISLTTTVVSAKPNLTASGGSWTTAHINGPSLGGYLSYFNGPFANDFLIKNDFLSLSETGTQLLGFGVCSCYNANVPFVAAQYGTGSTNLNQLTISDDVSYKIPLSGFWIAPTAGLLYVNSTYSSSAQALGLDDGYIFRVQGGAKIGAESLFNSMRVTTVLTGLIFSDVIVHGNNIQGGSFGQDATILSDEGKVQGEGIAMVNVDFGGGMSASVQGDVYGSKGIFGAGGKATIRMTW
jgi:hypothetical protein